jgi:hypothetical protein
VMGWVERTLMGVKGSEGISQAMTGAESAAQILHK